MVNGMLREHLQHEDEIYFPSLERVAGHITNDYAYNHESDKQALNELENMLSLTPDDNDSKAQPRAATERPFAAAASSFSRIVMSSPD